MDEIYTRNIVDLTKEELREYIVNLATALSSPIRLEILRQLKDTSMTISQIAGQNYLSVSSAKFHTALMESAGLITIKYMPSKKGKVRVCSLLPFQTLLCTEDPGNDVYFNRIRNLSLEELSQPAYVTFKQSCPVGSYTDGYFEGISGFASREEQMMFEPGNFFPEERLKAQILWTAFGYVEYSFGNAFAKTMKVNEIAFSMEICSETISYRDNWKSDLTFWGNGTELYTFTSPGDLGSRNGRLNPSWWSDISTKYGLLKTLTITRRGVFFDGILRRDDLTLDDLHIDRGTRITLRIGNKQDATYRGGFNLFGKGFGDYEQDVELIAQCKAVPDEPA